MTARSNDQIVARPRLTDAIGATLRGAFGAAGALPCDMALLVRRIDRTP